MYGCHARRPSVVLLICVDFDFTKANWREKDSADLWKGRGIRESIVRLCRTLLFVPERYHYPQTSLPCASTRSLSGMHFALIDYCNRCLAEQFCVTTPCNLDI